MYITFEEAAKRQLISGRVLAVLEYDKIRDLLTAQARTVYGRERCEALLPTSDFELVELWQGQTADAKSFIFKEGRLPLGALADIRPAIALSQAEGMLTQKSLLGIATFLRALIGLKAVLPLTREEIEGNLLLTQIAELMPLPQLEKEISFCILSEEEINDRASQELYQLRRKIRDSQNQIREILDRIIQKHGAALQEQLITLRGDRYVVPVKAERKGEIPGIVHDTSASGQTVFIEPIAVVETNNRIREYITQEKVEIEKILLRLTAMVFQETEALGTNVKLIAEIDFYAAKGTLALGMDACRPEVNQEGHIHLLKARHPLIDKKKVVPIDFRLGDEYRTLVITGPNTGGKTVSLKTCGLFCLMGMAGLHLPCDNHSSISVFTTILADIGDEQSIEQSLSTFSSHMKNLVSILETAGPASLVLVDELGSGTDPSEGAALAIAILDHLRRQGALTVATTHYKELKAYAIETDGVENACCEFDTETLSPTYRLLIGLPGVSNAFSISKKLGLSAHIIEAAQALLTEEGLRFEELLSSAEQNNRESEKLKQEMARLKQQVESERAALLEQQAQLEQSRQKVLLKAQEEKSELLEEAFEEVEQMIQAVRKASKEKDAHVAEAKMHQIRQNLRAGLTDLNSSLEKNRKSMPVAGEIPKEIKIGGLYFSPSLGVTGTIIQGPDSRGRCILQAGALRLTVTRDSLRYPEKVVASNQTAGTGKGKNNKYQAERSRASQLRSQKAAQVMPEIQLLGMTVDEAITTLDRYLDDCILSNIGTVRIVHGKGTGALRAAVAGHLKHDSRVKKFRLGTFGEGEDGVTIAEL